MNWVAVMFVGNVSLLLLVCCDVYAQLEAITSMVIVQKKCRITYHEIKIVQNVHTLPID